MNLNQILNITTIKSLYKTINYFIAIVWIINGFFCKVLNLVPRHEQIVSRILGGEYAHILTKLIGVSEIFMAVWILSNIKTRLNVWSQILIVAIMNILEFILVPDLLLWGKSNSIFAFLFIVLVFYNEFVLNKKLAH